MRVESRMMCRAQGQAVTPVIRAPISLAADVSGLDQLRVRDVADRALAAVVFQD